VTYTDAGSGTAKRRTRRRKTSIPPEEQSEIANRVVKFYNDEIINRKNEREARLQRYAKYRMWRSETDWPWPGASNTAIPDMAQSSMRVQDTLVNAVMSQNPPVISNAGSKADEEKQDTIDRLIQAQVFTGMGLGEGERLIGEMAESFVNDPACTIFIPWVREKRKTASIEIYDPIPDELDPADYFFGIVRKKYPGARRYDPSAAGWVIDVTLADDTNKRCCFYTDEDDQVEMVIEADAVVFDGPRPFVKDYDDVIFPARSANLQMPGPSNPNGATFVILRDFPTLSELRKLQASGFYDLVDEAKIDEIAAKASSTAAESESAQQKDTLAGTQSEVAKPKDTDHARFTRLVCFDVYDGEDKIFWVIKETRTLLKARLLIDMYPANPPRRPLVGESFVPVGGRYSGWSLLEIMESMHDTMKVIVDQSINAHDLSIASPMFYRPAGGMNPEVLRVEPYSMFPLQNPQQDINVPQFGNPQAMGASLNMISILGTWQEKLTMVSDINYGQIAPGSSSALRTIGGMSIVQGQNEARPERILRRFFTILTGVWGQIHQLNQSFLPKGKQFRIAGVVAPGDDPYVKIQNPEEIAGEYSFTFDANVLNTSKASLQAALESLMRTYINPLMMQMGIMTPSGAYRLARDYGRAYGQNVDQYIKPPTPADAVPRITAEEAIYSIVVHNQVPSGAPLEAGGAQEHLQKLVGFMNSDNFGHLTSQQVELFRAYLSQTQKRVAQEAQAQALQAQAAQFQQQRMQGRPGAPAQNAPQVPSQPPQISGPNEMMNETLPSAGGGANPNGAANP